MTASITRLLNSMRHGVDGAAAQLVMHLLPILRKRSKPLSRNLKISDEDDIAVEAFYELCNAVEAGRFEDVSDRTQLWQVLSMLAARKANDLRKYEGAKKRGGDATVVSFDQANITPAYPNESPEFQAEMIEQCELFIRSLPNDDLKSVVELKMRGLTNAEIGVELGFAVRTIQLMMVKIKEKMLLSFSR